MALPLEVAGSIPSRDELSRGQKKTPRYARRKAWPSRAWARVRGDFPRPGEAVLLPLNEKRWGPFTPRSRFFFVVHAMLLLHFHITSTYMLGVRLASAILSNSG